jgi:hypothetical protein
MWFADHAAAGSASYVVQRAFRLTGRLDAGALRAAAGAVVERHESLRTTFHQRGGVLRTALWPDQNGELMTCRAAGGDAEVAAAIRDSRRAPFDLSTGPLLRLDLFEVASDSAVLALTVHHIAVDAWSLAVLLHDLGRAYTALRSGRRPLLPPAPGPAEPGCLAPDAAAATHLAYWRRRLAGAAPTLDLPTDAAYADRRTDRARLAELTLDAAVRDRLGTLGRAVGCTPYMTVFALYAALLARWAGRDEVTVATFSAGRTRLEVSRYVGMLVNTVPTRTTVRSRDTLPRLLGRVRADRLADGEHDSLPYERIVAASGVRRDPDRLPLAQVAFDLRRAPSVPRLAGLSVTEWPIRPSTTRLELELHVEQDVGVLRCQLLAAADLFGQRTVDAAAAALRALAEEWSAAPDRQLGALRCWALLGPAREQTPATAGGVPPASTRSDHR